MDTNTPITDKRKFWTVYDYGTGGVWTVFLARSKEEIQNKFKNLLVYDYEHPPAGAKKEWLAQIESNGIYDIDSPPDKFLSSLVKQ